VPLPTGTQLRVGFDARYLSGPVLRGMDRYTVGLAGELSRRGVHVALFHRHREPLNPAHLRGLDCEVIGLRDRSGVHWEQVTLPLALKRGHYHLYHAPAERGIPVLCPCPAVLSLHSATAASYTDLVRRGLLAGRVRDYLGHDPRRELYRWTRFYYAAQYRRADCLLTPSRFARDEIVRLLGWPARRVAVTPLAVGEQFRRPRKAEYLIDEVLHRFRLRRPYLLYVGGFEPHKNVPGLLDMMAALRPRCLGLSLVVIGSKQVPDSLIAAAGRRGLRPGSDVVFLANLTDELVDIYDAAELFVTLSWRESFCLPLLEAMTRSVPVISSCWGAAPEVVGDGGVLVDPRDPQAAADAAADLLARKDRSDVAARAKRQSEQFSWAATAERTIQVYQRLITNSRVTAGAWRFPWAKRG
jgi:glycosyltransferase involved in cell wall biosynthesis